MPYDSDPDMKVLRSLVERFDASLTKIVDVTNEISKLLAVHDQRISNVEVNQKENSVEARKVETRIFDRVDSLLKRMEEHDKAVTEKINRLSEENDKRVVAIYEKILVNMTDANNSFYDRMESAHSLIDKRITENNISKQREIDGLNAKIDTMDKTIDTLKGRSWVLAGAIGVVVWVATQFGSKLFGW